MAALPPACSRSETAGGGTPAIKSSSVSTKGSLKLQRVSIESFKCDGSGLTAGSCEKAEIRQVAVVGPLVLHLVRAQLPAPTPQQGSE